MFTSSLKIALRNMLKHKGFTFINIAGLAVGMGFAVLIMLWVQFEVGFDRFHENTDRLHQVAFTNDEGTFHGDGMVGALAEYLQSEYPDITHASRFSYPYYWKLQHGEQTISSYGRLVDAGFLEMFSFEVLQGDAETALADPSSLVITKDLASRVFGDANPIGQTLPTTHGPEFKVAAVVEDPPDNTEFRFEFLGSLELEKERYDKWDVKNIKTYVMLAEGSDYREVSEKIREAYNIHNVYDTRNNLYLRPLKDVHLYSVEGGGRVTYLIVFSILAVAVLLIACINFTNLATACSMVRFREIGVKRVFGASRRQLVHQFLGESIVLSFMSMILAVVLVELFLPAINAITGLQLSVPYSRATMLGLVGIALLTGLLAGSYPAMVLSSLPPVAILRGQSSLRLLGKRRNGDLQPGNARGSSLRKTLVVSQFTAATLLLIAVIVIFKQINYVTEMEMGFNKDSILLFGIPGELAPHTTTLKNKLVENPNIYSVTVSASSLVEWWTSFSIDWEGRQPDEVFDMGYNAVDYDYLETFQMQMVEGRFFSRDYPSDATDAYVVNEATVRAMGVTDPVGRAIIIAANSSIEAHGTIIGVIKDYVTESVHKEIRPFMLGLSEQGSFMCMKIAANDIPATQRFIREKVSEVAPDARIRLRFFDEEVLRLYGAEVATGTVVVFIAVIAIFISCLGLFGLAAFMAQQRTKEIGIRKVLGASLLDLVKLLAREFIYLVLLANLIAWPFGYYIMTRWLDNYAYHTNIGWGVFAASGLLALIIAVITVSGQAVRAATANPVDSLRYE